MENKKGYLCYMNRKFTPQLVILLLAVAIYLYFGLGWAAVVVYIIFVLAIVALIAWRKSLDSRNPSAKPELTNVQVLKKDFEAIALERRKGQVANIISFAERLDVESEGMQRLAKRFDEWYIEYKRTNSIYHIDLYDYIINQCKERLKSAKAEYLKHELRLSIDIIRQFMRGRSVDDILRDIQG